MKNYIETKSGFARVCWKCGGTGIYWLRTVTANGVRPTQAVCFPCNGTGHAKKIFSSVEEIQKADARNEAAKMAREEKEIAKREAMKAQLLAEEAKREEARKQLQAENESWVYLDANTGDKVTVTGTVSVAKTIDTQYGASNLIVIETENKEAVKLFTTAQWAWDVDANQTITVTGTVKSFDEYEGRRQTQLARPKQI